MRAVAVSRRYVYSATSSGIAIYDRTFQTWLPPLSRELGLIESQINVLAGDPVEDALWLGVDGAVVMYRPQTEQVTAYHADRGARRDCVRPQRQR